jgi:hypothetical protein
VQYGAYYTATEAWSPVFDFVTDFGGGGSPLASVGAAFAIGDQVTLFDLTGEKFSVYSLPTAEFSPVFPIEELGDGTRPDPTCPVLLARTARRPHGSFHRRIRWPTRTRHLALPPRHAEPSSKPAG